jgi:hypothetical protein
MVCCFASAKTLLEVARNRAHLGADIGFFSVLHTWNQSNGLGTVIWKARFGI